MATFNFSLEEKVTIWKKTEFSVEAKTLEEAKKLAIKFHNEGNTEEIGWETIEGTEESMFPSRNNNLPTVEIYHDEDVIWDDTNNIEVNDKVKRKYYYELHVLISDGGGYSFGIGSDVELDEDEAIVIAKELNRFEEENDSDMVDSFDEIDEENFKNWYPKEYERIQKNS
jgi:hypothetical protein